MRLSTQREELLAQLQIVTRAASTRSAVQALSGVQLLAGGGSIELRATDMEIGLRVPLAGEVVRDGTVVLPARLLVDVVRSLPGDAPACGYCSSTGAGATDGARDATAADEVRA